MKNQGFTLIELLVVVLIIGILAAIAVPQYQKAVLKTKLHTGLPLVKALYQSQKSYQLATGKFANDIDLLDISIPKNSSCRKAGDGSYSRYLCDFGAVGIYDNLSNVQFIVPNTIAYLQFVKDIKYNKWNSVMDAKEGQIWCFAEKSNKIANDICKSMGGEYFNTDTGTTPPVWTRYIIK